MSSGMTVEYAIDLPSPAIWSFAVPKSIVCPAPLSQYGQEFPYISVS